MAIDRNRRRSEYPRLPLDLHVTLLYHSLPVVHALAKYEEARTTNPAASLLVKFSKQHVNQTRARALDKLKEEIHRRISIPVTSRSGMRNPARSLRRVSQVVSASFALNAKKDMKDLMSHKAIQAIHPNLRRIAREHVSDAINPGELADRTAQTAIQAMGEHAWMGATDKIHARVRRLAFLAARAGRVENETQFEALKEYGAQPWSETESPQSALQRRHTKAFLRTNAALDQLALLHLTTHHSIPDAARFVRIARKVIMEAPTHAENAWKKKRQS